MAEASGTRLAVELYQARSLDTRQDTLLEEEDAFLAFLHLHRTQANSEQDDTEARKQLVEEAQDNHRQQEVAEQQIAEASVCACEYVDASAADADTVEVDRAKQLSLRHSQRFVQAAERQEEALAAAAAAEVQDQRSEAAAAEEGSTAAQVELAAA